MKIKYFTYAPNTVIVHTIVFWYMIKNKEATDSAALEFCHILNKFAAQLDDCLSLEVYKFLLTSKRVFVGNWVDQRLVQNVSKIPPL